MSLDMRKHYIDNFRWIILLILIPYHTAMAWRVCCEISIRIPILCFLIEKKWDSNE